MRPNWPKPGSLANKTFYTSAVFSFCECVHALLSMVILLESFIQILGAVW